MKRKLAKGMAVALTLLAVSPALAQEGQMGDPERDDPTAMDGMPMGQGMMQDGMMQGRMMQVMQMMSHCTSAMEQMHGEPEGMGEVTGIDGMGMPGMMGGNETAGFSATTAEALARAFVRGRSGGDAAPVEIVGVTVEDGSFIVVYRQGDSQGTVLVNAETGEVTEADRR